MVGAPGFEPGTSCSQSSPRYLCQVQNRFAKAPWSDPATAHRERKRIVRLIVEDATLIRGAAEVTVHVRFRGGATCTRTVPRALAAWETWQTSPEVVALIDKLLDDHTNTEIASILNERGVPTACQSRKAAAEKPAVSDIDPFHHWFALMRAFAQVDRLPATPQGAPPGGPTRFTFSLRPATDA